MNKTKSLFCTLAVSLAFVVMMPAPAVAQTTITYQPRTTAEMIAYLYGRIAQLIEIREMLLDGGGQETDYAFDFVTVETHRATEKTDSKAVLRGEVNLFGDATAKVWFEYGEDEDFLDQKTRQVSVDDVYDRTVRTEVSRLEEDERYYFRIVALSDSGAVTYGDIFGFRTEESD